MKFDVTVALLSKLRGKSKIGYREVYVIDMEPASGVADRLFVDAQTYLPVRLNGGG